MSAQRPTEQFIHAMKPSPFVLFMRRFFLYQLWRFLWINLRMTRMILLSHAGRVEPRARTPVHRELTS